MGSLAACLAQLSKAGILPPDERAAYESYFRAKAEELRDRGLNAKERSVQAIKDHLEETLNERRRIVQTAVERLEPLPEPAKATQIAAPVAVIEPVEAVKQAEVDLSGAPNAAVEIPKAETEGVAVAKTANDPTRSDLMGSLQTDPSQGPPTRTSASGKGVERIREFANREDSQLSQPVKQVLNALLDEPALKSLWEQFSVETYDLTTSPFQAMISFTDRIIAMDPAKVQENGSTVAHEIFHAVFESLPQSARKMVEAERLRELTKVFGDGNIPEEFLAGMNSRAFTAKALPDESYHLINPSEYFAHMTGDLYAKSLKGREDEPFLRRVIQQFKDWTQAVADTIARVTKRQNVGQIMRDVLSGKLKLGQLREESELAGSLYRKAADAENEARLAMEQRERDVVGAHALGQAFDLHQSLSKLAGNASERTQKLLGLHELNGIVAEGAKNNRGVAEGYREIKARLTSEFDRKLLAVVAGQKQELFSHQLEILRREQEKMARTVESPSFMDKMERQVMASARAENTDLTQRVYRSMLTTAMQKLTQALKDEKVDDKQRAFLSGQLREINDAQRSSSAMSQLLRDIVDKLASTPDGMKLLEEGGKTEDFRRVYRDLKNSVGEPLHNENLIHWATYLLNKAPSIRNQLLAMNLAGDSGVRAQLGPYEQKFISDFKQNPARTIEREMRKTEKLTSDRLKAQFVSRTLNRELHGPLQKYADLTHAVEIGTRAVEQLEASGLRGEIRQDRGQVGNANLKPTEAFSDKILLIPDDSGGTTELNFDFSQLGGSRATVNRMRQPAKMAIDKLEKWLTEHTPNDPAYAYHARNKQLLEDTLGSGSMLYPNDPFRLHSSAWKILWKGVSLTSGPVRAGLTPFVRRLEASSSKVQGLTQRLSAKVMDARLKAMAAHGYKFSDVNKNLMTLDEAHAQYRREVLNPLAASWNRQVEGLRVGDLVGSAGKRVLPADMEALRIDSQGGSEMFALVPDQYSKDTRGGVITYRKAQKTSEYMTPREPNLDVLAFAKPMAEARDAWMKAADATAKEAALAEMERLFRGSFEQTAFAFTEDRSAEFVKNATLLDGEGGAFDVVRRRMQAGEIDTPDTYFTALSEASGLELAEVKRIVLNDYSKQAAVWYETFKPEPETVGNFEPTEAKNAFTRGRTEAVANYSFYHYGFADSRAVSRFGAGVYSRHFDTVQNALGVAVEDLLRQQTEFATKVREAQAKGVRRPIQFVQKGNDLDRVNDKTYDNYYDLQNRIDSLRALRTALGADTAPDPYSLIDRTIKVIIKSTLGAKALTWDIATNPVGLGRTARHFIGSQGAAEVTGRKVWLTVAVKNLLSMAGSAGKATFLLAGLDPYSLKSVGIGWGDGGLAGAALHAFGDKSFAKSVERFLLPLIKEVNENMRNRLSHNMAMLEAGVAHPRDHVTQWTNQLLGGLVNQGQLLMDRGDQRARWKVPFHVLLGSIETILEPQAAGYRMSDEHVNNSHYALMLSKAGPLESIQKQLDKLHVRIEQGARDYNYEQWDAPENELSPKEIQGALATQTDKYNLLRVMEMSDVDLRKEIHEYMRQIRDKNPDRQFISDAKRAQIADANMDRENRATLANTSNALKDDSFITKMVRPFQSWSVRMTNNLRHQFDYQIKGADDFKALRQKRLRAITAVTIAMGSFLGASIITGITGSQALRIVNSVGYNQVSASRQPWDRKGAKGVALGLALAAVAPLPYIGTIFNAAFDDAPTRANLSPTLAVIEKAKALLEYIGGVYETGNPSYRLVETIKAMNPDSGIILNRLPSESGKRELINQANLLRRKGDPDLLKPIGMRTAPHATELTPYGAELANAAVNGDMETFRQKFDKAVEKAREMGKANPEQSVIQAIKSQTPEGKALKSNMTAEQREEFFAKLSEDQKASFTKVEDNIASALASVGSSIGYVRTPREPGDSARSSGGSASAPRATPGRSAARRGLGIGPAALPRATLVRSRSSRGRGRPRGSRNRISRGRTLRRRVKR